MRASLRPRGCRIGGGSKLKCLELMPLAPASSWPDAWHNYDSATFDTRMAYAKNLGANSVKIACNGSQDHGFPAPAVTLSRIQDFCRLLRKYDLRLYLALVGPAEFVGNDGQAFATQVPKLMQGVDWWYQHGRDLLVGIDVCNEVNYNGVATWGGDVATPTAAMRNDLSAFMAQTRLHAPGIPVAFSVYMGRDHAYDADAYVQLQAQVGCDFHDIHMYNGWNDQYYVSATPSSAPKLTDIASLVAAPWFLGSFINGECGIVNTVYTTDKQFLRRMDDATYSAWIDGMASVAQHPKSVGAVLFGDRDYGDAAKPAEFGPIGITGFPVAEAAFQRWLTSQI